MFWRAVAEVRRQRHPPQIRLLVASLFLAAVGFAAVSAPILMPYPPDDISLADSLAPPGSRGHLLGADKMGRDVLSRLLDGSRVSLAAGILPALGAMLVGVFLGILAGYSGGALDMVLMRLIDIIMAFPFMLLAIALIAALGPSLVNAMIAVAVVSVPRYTRLMRGGTLSLKQREFIIAARSTGVRIPGLLWKHILPNVFPTALALVSIDMGTMIVSTASLSFLGLGVQPPRADWGQMISDGKTYITTAPHLVLIPAAVLSAVVYAFAVVGDAIQVRLDPRVRRGF